MSVKVAGWSRELGRPGLICIEGLPPESPGHLIEEMRAEAPEIPENTSVGILGPIFSWEFGTKSTLHWPGFAVLTYIVA